MPQYEMVYIVRPDLEPEAVQPVVARVGQRVTEQGGSIDFVEVWGKRRLASSLGKFREGIYVLTRFTIDSTHIPEFKRPSRIMDNASTQSVTRLHRLPAIWLPDLYQNWTFTSEVPEPVAV